MRYVLEGEWSGYTSAQRHVAHREVIDTRRHGKERIERLGVLRTIVFTDGTSLNLSLREAEPREVVPEKLGYPSMIRDAEALGKAVVNVSELQRKQG